MNRFLRAHINLFQLILTKYQQLKEMQILDFLQVHMKSMLTPQVFVKYLLWFGFRWTQVN